MGRLHDRVSHALQQAPLDLDYLEFVCAQEIVFLGIVSEHVHVSQEVTDILLQLSRALQDIRQHQQQNPPPPIQLERTHGRGRPTISICIEYLQHLVEFGIPMATVANFLGVSRATVYRRMAANNISVRGQYSTCTDAELDGLVSEIKNISPHAGYRSVKGMLEGAGHRLQWYRVRASMHRVDSLGILTRMRELGCVVRRTYSVPCSKYLVHIDTNHKLIR